MNYLLDTNVISETMRREPDARMMAWLHAIPEERFHLSVLTLGELAKGVRLLPPGERRERLRIWLDEELPERFGKRILPVDQGTAQRWGKLMADTHRTLPAIDGLLAATAFHHDLRLVTRNVADFSHLGLEVINPWTWD